MLTWRQVRSKVISCFGFVVHNQPPYTSSLRMSRVPSAYVLEQKYSQMIKRIGDSTRLCRQPMLNRGYLHWIHTKYGVDKSILCVRKVIRLHSAISIRISVLYKCIYINPYLLVSKLLILGYYSTTTVELF